MAEVDGVAGPAAARHSSLVDPGKWSPELQGGGRSGFGNRGWRDKWDHFDD